MQASSNSSPNLPVGIKLPSSPRLPNSPSKRPNVRSVDFGCDNALDMEAGLSLPSHRISSVFSYGDSKMRRPLCKLACFSILVVVASTAVAADFRVKSLIYQDPEPTVLSTSWTIFSGGKVYDFRHQGNSGTADEITLFDPAARTFTLLNRSRHVTTTVRLDDVQMFTAQLKAHATDPQKQHLDFLINPQMNVKYNETSKRITIECEKLTYSAVGIAPRDETAIAAYRMYADWSAQLNTIRGSLPPFVRMRLNRELASRRMIPRYDQEKHADEARRQISCNDAPQRTRHQLGTDQPRPPTDRRGSETRRRVQGRHVC